MRPSLKSSTAAGAPLVGRVTTPPGANLGGENKSVSKSGESMDPGVKTDVTLAV